MNFALELMKRCPEWLEPSFLVPTETVERQLTSGIGNPASGKQHRAKFLQRFLAGMSPEAEVWHCLHQFPSHLPHPQSKVILTVHDLNFLSEKKGFKKDKYLRRLQKNVDRASAVTVISEYTAGVLKDNIDTGTKPVVTIYDGVRLEYRSDACIPHWLPEKPFFFCLSVFKEQKNLECLIEMMEHFPDHLLVLAGNDRTPYGRRIREAAKNSTVAQNIFIPGIIEDDEKFWLYKNCRAFLFPSLAEGFGLPVIEAMMAGTQVFLSRSTSLPEIGGVIAYYWDSFDSESMAGVVRQGLEMREKQPRAFSREIREYAMKFEWENCINEFIELYRGFRV